MAGNLAASMAMKPAGCPTRLADPPWKATPSAFVPRPLPNGNFPGGVTFRLPTPENVGIGVRINDFRPPEKESYQRTAALNGQNFARGHNFFDHYSDMQQRAKFLVPTLPRHSRVDELKRVWEDELHHEAEREAHLAFLDFHEQQRLEKLRQTRGLLQHGPTARQVGRTLQQVCSLPVLTGPAFGSATPAMELMNRRVDVNRLRRMQKQRGPANEREQRARLEEREARLEEVVDGLSAFERAHLPEVDSMRTTTDWTSKMPKRQLSSPPNGRREKVAPNFWAVQPNAQRKAQRRQTNQPGEATQPSVGAVGGVDAGSADGGDSGAFRTSFSFDCKQQSVRFEM